MQRKELVPTKKTALFFLLLLCLILSGCGGPKYTYDGTYDEEVLRKLQQDIIIDGHRISLPCTLADLGEDFSYSQYGIDSTFLVLDSRGFAETILEYKGVQVAQVSFNLSYDPNHDYTDDLITHCNLFGQDVDWSVGPIVRGKTTLAEVEEQLGAPGYADPETDENRVLTYGVDRLQVIGKADGPVHGVWLAMNTDPVWEAPPPAVYDGSWHEDTLAQLGRDIRLNDRHISMPFTVEELGVGYSLNWDGETGKWYTVDLPTSKYVLLALDYYGEPVAQVVYPASAEPDHDYSRDPVLMLMPEENPRCSFVIGGMVPGSITAEQLVEKLGPPQYRTPGRFLCERYSYGEQGLVADVDTDGNVKELYLRDPTSPLLAPAQAMPTDDYAYNGTCTPEVIRHLGENILIQGRPLKLGQTLADLGDGFGIELVHEAKNPENKTCVAVTKDGESLFLWYYPPAGEDHDYRNDPIEEVALYSRLSTPLRTTCFYSIGPIALFSTTLEEVETLLGPAEDRLISEDGSQRLDYCHRQLRIYTNEYGLVEEIRLRPQK